MSLFVNNFLRWIAKTPHTQHGGIVMESEEKPKRRFWKVLFAAAATSYNISNFGAIAPARIFFPVSVYMAKCEGIRARQFPCKVDPDQKSNQSTHGRFKGQFPFRM